MADADKSAGNGRFLAVIAAIVLAGLSSACGSDERGRAGVGDLDLGTDVADFDVDVTGPLGERGYQRRACGFDLDDDNILGEPEDCTICDGTTADPDGDGVDEDLIYVDADSGSDTAGDGTPAAPFQTIQHAWDQADGPDDGAEDIICFHGTATTEQDIVPRVSGVPGIRLAPASGSEARDWEFPANPTMLVGWDWDADGQYPPFDGDDLALLDGGPGQLTRAFQLNEHGQPPIQYLEIAHLRVRDYGHTFVDDGDTGIGFVFLGRANGTSSHLYFHDLELENINKDKPNRSSAINFNFFVGGLEIAHFAVVNIQSLETGSYFARGDFGERPEDPAGPVRFQRLTVTAHGCDFGVPPCGDHGSQSSMTGFKIWGYLDGMEILDSVFDGNVQAWSPRPSGPTNAIIANGCVVDWVVRNNLVRNFRNAFAAKGTGNSGVVDNGGFCRSRAVDHVVFDRNTVLWDIDYYQWGVIGLSMNDERRATVGGSIANVTATNNFFIAPGGFRFCLNVTVSNDQAPAPGRIAFVGNTCYGGQDSGLGAMVSIHRGEGRYPYPNLILVDNLFSGFEVNDDGAVMDVDYEPTSFEVHHNAYSPGAEFRWMEDNVGGLAEWQALTGLDEGSVGCTPSYVDEAAHDLHLDEADGCAAGAGTAYDGLGGDYDGDSRPLGDPDIGADEIE